MGQFSEVVKTRNKGKSPNLRAGIRKQIMSMGDGQNLEPKTNADDIIIIIIIIIKYGANLPIYEKEYRPNLNGGICRRNIPIPFCTLPSNCSTLNPTRRATRPLQQSPEQLDHPTRSAILLMRQSLTEKMAIRFSRRYYDGAKHKVHFCTLTWSEVLHDNKPHYDEYFNVL